MIVILIFFPNKFVWESKTLKFKGVIKVLFYTIIPLEFVNYIPGRLIGDFNLNYFLLVMLVAISIISLSFIIF